MWCASYCCQLYISKSVRPNHTQESMPARRRKACADLRMDTVPPLDIPDPPSTPPPPQFNRRRSLTRHLSPSSPYHSPAPGTFAFPDAPTLRTQPLLTLQLFGAYISAQVAACARSVAVHPATALTVYPGLLVYATAKLCVPGNPILHEFEVRWPHLRASMCRLTQMTPMC